MQLKPTKLDTKQIAKVIKTGLYIALSGAIAALIAYATDHKEAIGVYWPVVNFLIVFLKQVFTVPKS